MRKKLIALAITGLMAVCLLGYAGLGVAGDDGSPGTVDDPLVTKSFVENYMQKVLAEFKPAGGGSLAWSVAELKPGDNFIGKSGTEFILRAGSAIIVDPSGGGVPDLTAGTNVPAGGPVAKNHLFSLPRDDGRGIQAQTDCVIMYRGF
ncbi:MAG: hypothetical protein MJA84_02420 [Firmicutes bacterium]|nr:hypothetical protein [Bacillota bacterium]